MNGFAEGLLRQQCLQAAVAVADEVGYDSHPLPASAATH